MKKSIHPTYHDEIEVTCACGAVFKTGSTMDSIRVELCSRCHPFFTGKEKFVDTAGRVEKFKALEEKTKAAQEKRKGKKTKRAQRNAKKQKDESGK